jgi:hypothetical protein
VKKKKEATGRSVNKMKEERWKKMNEDKYGKEWNSGREY